MPRAASRGPRAARTGRGVAPQRPSPHRPGRVASPAPGAAPPAAERLAEGQVVVAAIALRPPVGDAERAHHRVHAEEDAAGGDPVLQLERRSRLIHVPVLAQQPGVDGEQLDVHHPAIYARPQQERVLADQLVLLETGQTRQPAQAEAALEWRIALERRARVRAQHPGVAAACRVDGPLEQYLLVLRPRTERLEPGREPRQQARAPMRERKLVELVHAELAERFARVVPARRQPGVADLHGDLARLAHHAGSQLAPGPELAPGGERAAETS